MAGTGLHSSPGTPLCAPTAPRRRSTYLSQQHNRLHRTTYELWFDPYVGGANTRHSTDVTFEALEDHIYRGR